MKTFTEIAEDLRKRKIDAAIAALPDSTPGNWWCSASGEMLSDPTGSTKIARYVSGHSPRGAGANRAILEAAQDLAHEVERLRNQPPIHMTAKELEEFIAKNPQYSIPEKPLDGGERAELERLRKCETRQKWASTVLALEASLQEAQRKVEALNAAIIEYQQAPAAMEDAQEREVARLASALTLVQQAHKAVCARNDALEGLLQVVQQKVAELSEGNAR